MKYDVERRYFHRTIEFVQKDIVYVMQKTGRIGPNKMDCERCPM